LHLGRLTGARRTVPHHAAARLAEKAGAKISRLFLVTLAPFSPEADSAFEGSSVQKNAMNITLTCGSELLIAGWPGEIPPTVEQLLAAARTTRPELVAAWCDEQDQLRESLPVFINGQHLRYRQGLQTKLKDGDEVYIIPLIAGG